MSKISVVVNTLNEEKNLPRLLVSIQQLADEIVVVDMQSIDKTVEIAKKAGAKVFKHKRTGYVEPARNFAISKTEGDWILILDADEELQQGLARKLREIADSASQGLGPDFYRIPRKNIVFGKWLKHSRWWPDLNIRFFKKGSVKWSEVIHSIPMTKGRGIDLPAKEDLAIIHHHYQSIEQFLRRMNRYTTIQANHKIKEGHRFIWPDLIRRPSSEFLGRYFHGQGYKDGLHGLALSLLQAFSELVLYLKIWQEEKFLGQQFSLPEVDKEIKKTIGEYNWWSTESLISSKNLFSSFFLRIKRKFLNG